MKGAYEQALARKEKKPEKVLVAKAKSREEDRQIEHESRVQAIERVGEVLPLLDAYYDSAAEYSRGLESPLESVVKLIPEQLPPNYERYSDFRYYFKFENGTLTVSTEWLSKEFTLRVQRLGTGTKSSRLTREFANLLTINYDGYSRSIAACIGGFTTFLVAGSMMALSAQSNVTPEQTAILAGSALFGAAVTAFSDSIARYVCQTKTVEVEGIPYGIKGKELLMVLSELEWLCYAIPFGIEKALNDYGRKPQPALKSG